MTGWTVLGIALVIGFAVLARYAQRRADEAEDAEATVDELVLVRSVRSSYDGLPYNMRAVGKEWPTREERAA